MKIAERLQRIRSLTDLDGSLWWWPYAYGSKDPKQPTRGGPARKCGWGAAVYLCLFINDILGISVDVAARSIGFAPFVPWKEFIWQRAKIGWATFDLSYHLDEGEVSAILTNKKIIATPAQSSSRLKLAPV